MIRTISWLVVWLIFLTGTPDAAQTEELYSLNVKTAKPEQSFAHSIISAFILVVISRTFSSAYS